MYLVGIFERIYHDVISYRSGGCQTSKIASQKVQPSLVETDKKINEADIIDNGN